MGGSPSVAELFTHIHYVRLVFISEDAPEFARRLPVEEWMDERDPDRLAQMLNDSAQAVRDAVRSRVERGQDMNLHYDHPILLLQHMIWHEGYHHGPDQAGPQGDGPPANGSGRWSSRVAGLDAQEVSDRLNFLRSKGFAGRFPMLLLRFRAIRY